MNPRPTERRRPKGTGKDNGPESDALRPDYYKETNHKKKNLPLPYSGTAGRLSSAFMMSSSGNW